MSRSFIPSCLLAVSLFFAATARTFAQNPPPDHTAPKPNGRPNLPPELQGHKVVLSKPISYDNPRSPLKNAGEIPIAPQFPGKFGRGDVQDLANERVYTATIYAKEKQKEVFEWYRNELSSGNWKLLSGSGNSVTASDKSGNIVVVGVSNATLPGYKASIAISVRQRTSK
jgi:hypothetical protein